MAIFGSIALFVVVLFGVIAFLFVSKGRKMTQEEVAVTSANENFGIILLIRLMNMPIAHHKFF